MKYILIPFVALGVSACSTTPKREPTLADENAYLRYVVESMQHQQRLNQQGMGPELMDSATLVERVCVSKPIYDAYGNYVRTSVKCR